TAALVEAAFPAASDVGIKALLLNSVDPSQYLASTTASGGRLNAATAVSCVGIPKIWFESPAAGFAVDVARPISITAIATRCADAGGVDVSASANGTPVALTARGDGLYIGTYTPATAGAVTITLTATS